MLSFRMVSPTILEIIESVLGFCHTERRYFYKDTSSWEDLTNPYATKQLVADGFKYRRKMTELQREWVQKHYLSKVKPFSEDNSKCPSPES